MVEKGSAEFPFVVVEVYGELKMDTRSGADKVDEEEEDDEDDEEDVDEENE